MGEGNNLKSAAVAGSLTERLDGSKRLARFFGKMLEEAVHLEVDSVSFVLGQSQMTALLCQGRNEIKTLDIKTSWFEPIYKWISDRCCDVFENLLTRGGEGSAVRGSVAAFRVGEHLVVFRLRKSERRAGERRIILSEIDPVPLSRAFETLGVSAAAMNSFIEIGSGAAGIILAAAPNSEILKDVCATILAVTGTDFAGFISDPVLKASAGQVSKQESFLVACNSSDPIDALLKFKEQGYDFSDINLRAVVCQVFVRKTCHFCARETVIERKLIDVLPDCLRPDPEHPYLVGRGCDVCSQKGYQGRIGVQGVLVVDDAVQQLLLENVPQGKLIEHLYPLGLRSLLEDGVEKVLAGSTTFQSLYECVNTMPDAYIKSRMEAVNSRKSRMAPIEEEVDFFGHGQSQPSAKPLTGKAAFFEGAAEEESSAAGAEFVPDSAGRVADADAPLFANPPSAKGRPKPLLLVVEDDEDQRNIIEIVLKSAGYQVQLTNNGNQALNALRKDLPDLILTDLMMPEMDGAELVRQLKAHREYRKIPVMVLTVVSDRDKEYTLLDLGADDYCEKTIQRKILLKRIENMLRRSKGE